MICYNRKMTVSMRIFKEDIKKMSLQVEKLEKNMAKLTIEVPEIGRAHV